MAKYKLTKYQKETMLRYNLEEKTLYMDVFDRTLIRHLEKTLGLKPIHIDESGERYYNLPLSWFRFPQKPRNLKPETRAVLAERMRDVAKRRKKRKNQQ